MENYQSFKTVFQNSNYVFFVVDMLEKLAKLSYSNDGKTKSLTVVNSKLEAMQW
jgi:hypothetical protein